MSSCVCVFIFFGMCLNLKRFIEATHSRVVRNAKKGQSRKQTPETDKKFLEWSQTCDENPSAVLWQGSGK